MEISEIKEEVQHSEEFKVKLEKNLSSIVYEVKVTSEVDIKPKQEHPPQSPTIPVTKEEIQSVIYTTVKPDHDSTSDDLELELEPESKITSNGESDSDCNEQHPQQSKKSLQGRLIRSTQNRKGEKRCVKNPKIQIQCSLCPLSFTTVTFLITHARTKHAMIQNPSFKSATNNKTVRQCPLCSKFFTTIYSLQTHFLRFHIKNKPFQCSICLESKNEVKKFATENILEKHKKLVHDSASDKYQCGICSLKCQNACHYKRHKGIHLEKQYKCEYCSKVYRVKERMLRHIIAVHKEYTDRHETFKCDECGKLFCSKKDLDKHVLQTHEEGTVQCKTCYKKFREEWELSKHLDVAHRENRTWLLCDVCTKVFKNNKNLIQHLEVEHRRLFNCRKCFRSFVSKEEYDNHSTVTLDKEGRKIKRFELQCKVCLVFLNTECAFTTHKDTHVNPSEIKRKIVPQLDPDDPQECLMKCDFCPKTFVQKSLLLDHATKCHPNQKLKCKSCEKSFQAKFQLNKHELLHFTKKVFECQICHKGFTRLKCLNQHEEIHKIDKRYKCSQCEKSFAVSSTLRRHMANYHGGAKPFKCVVCQKAFVFKALLVRHSIVHTDERPFSCSKCSYSTKSDLLLRTHQKRIHPENPSERYRKSVSRPVRVGPHSKYFENLVYICCLEKCDFETKDEKEVAIHNAMHGLPQLTLFRELRSPPSKNWDASTLTSRENIKKRTVQPRFKCKHGSQMFTTSENLKKHVTKFHSGTRNRNVVRYAVVDREESKFDQNLIFVCDVKKCLFETKDEKEVAIHYAKHKLPKVALPRLLYDPSCKVFLSKSTSMNAHAIQARYKCAQCCKSFRWPGEFGKHTRICLSRRKTKIKKGIYVVSVSSSDEDEM